MQLAINAQTSYITEYFKLLVNMFKNMLRSNKNHTNVTNFVSSNWKKIHT